MNNDKPMNFFQRLAKVFVAPSEVLQNIKGNPKFTLPFLYVFVISAITSILQRPLIQLQQEELQNLYIERYGIDIFSTSQKGLLSADSILLNIFGIFLTLWITWLIGSLFLFILSKLFRGSASYKQLLSLEIHAGMLTSTLALIITPICLLLDSPATMFSLSILYPGGNITSLLYNILSAITLFSVWAAIFKGMGLYILNGFSKIKGYLISAFVYIIAILFTAVSAGMSFWIFDKIYKKAS